MAARPRLNSYKRTAPSRAPFWMLSWLTCLFLKNVQCAFYTDSARTWLPRAQTTQETVSLHDFVPSALSESRPTSDIRTLQPPELDYLNNIVDLVNAPWPESHPFPRDNIDNTLPPPQSVYFQDTFNFAKRPRPESHPIHLGTNTHPPPVQQERQIDLDELGTPVMKKMKTSSGVDDPPFEIVNSKRPGESDRQLVFEAIRSLKKTNGIRLIGNEREGQYKMLEIREDQISNFLFRVEKRGRSLDPFLQIGMVRPPGMEPKEFNRKQQDRRWSAVSLFMKEANNRKKKVWSLYTDRVIPQFENLTKQLEEKISRTYSGSQETYLLDDLERTLQILPVYLFHVDLINTLIPAQEVKTKGATTLQSQRQAAGEQFF
ncbi:hypothetical protein PTTG_29375, partial [Puccinia triticina 1-1 BBBD Race 1]